MLFDGNNKHILSWVELSWNTTHNIMLIDSKVRFLYKFDI